MCGLLFLMTFELNFTSMSSKKNLKTTVEEHLVNKPQFIRDLFTVFKEKIREFENVEEKAVDPYVGYKFRLGNRRPRLFVELHIQIEKIELHLRNIDYINRSSLVIREAPGSHEWTLSKLVVVNNKDELADAMRLIEQSYKNVL